MTAFHGVGCLRVLFRGLEGSLGVSFFFWGPEASKGGL